MIFFVDSRDAAIRGSRTSVPTVALFSCGGTGVWSYTCIGIIVATGVIVAMNSIHIIINIIIIEKVARLMRKDGIERWRGRLWALVLNDRAHGISFGIYIFDSLGQGCSLLRR